MHRSEMAGTDENRPKRKRRLISVAEEEAWLAENEQQQKLADEEAANRQSAIDEMMDWFGEQFEDPQNETPYDSEDGDYVYVFGGPFDAHEVLSDQFGSEYDENWIEAAAEHIQADGTFDWAPSSTGDYYEHPERDEVSDATPSVEVSLMLSARIIDRLDTLESLLTELSLVAPSIGHNQPPGEVGLPPYDEDSRHKLKDAITATRQEIQAPLLDRIHLQNAEGTFRRVGTEIAIWIGKKLNLAVDETIKAGVKTVSWIAIAKLSIGLANDIIQLLRLH